MILDDIKSSRTKIIYVDEGKIEEASKLLKENDIDNNIYDVGNSFSAGVLNSQGYTKQTIMERIPENRRNIPTILDDIVESTGIDLEQNALDETDLELSLDETIFSKSYKDEEE